MNEKRRDALLHMNITGHSMIFYAEQNCTLNIYLLDDIFC